MACPRGSRMEVLTCPLAKRAKTCLPSHVPRPLGLSQRRAWARRLAPDAAVELAFRRLRREELRVSPVIIEQLALTARLIVARTSTGTITCFDRDTSECICRLDCGANSFFLNAHGTLVVLASSQIASLLTVRVWSTDSLESGTPVEVTDKVGPFGRTTVSGEGIFEDDDRNHRYMVAQPLSETHMCYKVCTRRRS